MRAILLAAGLGTRLRPLSLELPKPAMPLGLSTLGGASLRSLYRAGFREVAVNSHYLAERLEHALRADLDKKRGNTPKDSALASGFRDGSASGSYDDLSLRFFYEPELLGTGGGVRNIASHQGSADYLIVNGDSLYLPDLRAAIRAHQERDAFATLLLRQPDGSAKRTIRCAPTGEIEGILQAGDDRERTHAFTGTQILSARALAQLPESGCVIRDMCIPALERGERLVGWVDDAPFRDLGTVESYYEAHFENGTPMIHEDAEIEPGAHIENSWIGAGARILEGASVVDSIVWPGALWERGELRRSILTKTLRVTPGESL